MFSRGTSSSAALEVVETVVFQIGVEETAYQFHAVERVGQTSLAVFLALSLCSGAQLVWQVRVLYTNVVSLTGNPEEIRHVW